MSERVEERLGWIASVSVHALLVLVFLMATLELRPFVLDFTAVDFAPLSEIDAGGSSVLPEFGGGQPIIELPTSPRIDDESPLLKLKDINRPVIESIPTDDKPTLIAAAPRERGLVESLLPVESGLKQRAPVRPMPIGDEILSGQRPDALAEKLAGDEIFSITWEGQKRNKIGGALPEFPEGLNKAATIRVSIEVSPTGSVIFAAPQTKGLPALEKASLDAVRTWKFNPLDKSISQDNQKGVVTFVFKLK